MVQSSNPSFCRNDNKDPNVKALKRRGFIDQGSTLHGSTLHVLEHAKPHSETFLLT